MKQLVLTIGAKDYTVQLDDEFAAAFSQDMQTFLQNRTQFAVTDLLKAFVGKCHESYSQKKQMDALVVDLDKSLG